MRANELDVVRLKDGRVVTVLEVYGGGACYLVENSDEYGRAIDIFEILENEISGIEWEFKGQNNS